MRNVDCIYLSERGSLLFIFIAIGQGVNVGVVEHASFAVTEEESLSADAQVLVGDELWSHKVGVVLLFLQVCVDVNDSETGDAAEKGCKLPFLHATWRSMTPWSMARHLPSSGCERSTN